ncbi:DUF4157 domain-containing protein [Streptomyces sparsogenes]|uniref:eCIS core domain-containing protein n=1 Tax=Streptomyces sparsogenes TaxID=67365 RepID=UPI003401E49D
MTTRSPKARCHVAAETAWTRPARPSVLERPDPLLTARRSVGNAYVQRTARCGDEGGGNCCESCRLCKVQAKLIVGPSADPREREADQIAERVFRMSPWVTGDGAASELAARGEGEPPPIHPLSGSPATSTGGSVEAELPTGGRPLPDAVLAYMEPRFGRDLSAVRVHTDPDTQQLADRFQARAFTVGHDVHLGRGESEYDHRLMAHELTHVVQQQGVAGPSVARRVPDDKPEGIREPRATDFAGIDVEFDGAELVVRGDGREIFRFPAQSGRPVRLAPEHAQDCGADPATDTYMNDRRFVGIRDFGPIPEGTYVFAPPGIEKFTLGERLALELAGVIGVKTVTVGGRQIHSGDWGSGRVALHPRGHLRQGPCGDVAKRDGFFLHGGNLSGSSGCIDVGGDFDSLATFFTGYRKPVSVSVEYKKPSPSVGVVTGLSGAVAYGRFQLGHGPALALGAEFTPTGGRPLAGVGYNALLQWAGGALATGVRLDIPFTDKEAFVRFGLSGGLDFRVFGPLYGRLFGGYSWDVSGSSKARGHETGGALRLDLNRYHFEALYNILRPASQDERIHQALVRMGFKF